MVVQITFLYACKKYKACEINEKYVCYLFASYVLHSCSYGFEACVVCEI